MLSIMQGMVIVNTWVFILRRYKWHIHAGSWSLVNCWREALSKLHYIRVLMNINECGYRPSWMASALMVIGVSAWYPDIPLSSMKEEALPACKETIVRNIPWSLRDRVMQQIWMYYKEKLTKNLADLNTFETNMSLRDRVTTSNEPYSLCLFTYVHTALKWLRGAKILQHTPVEKSQWHLWET